MCVCVCVCSKCSYVRIYLCTGDEYTGVSLAFPSVLGGCLLDLGISPHRQDLAFGRSQKEKPDLISGSGRDVSQGGGLLRDRLPPLPGLGLLLRELLQDLGDYKCKYYNYCCGKLLLY